jgi:hypothetical protein
MISPLDAVIEAMDKVKSFRTNPDWQAFVTNPKELDALQRALPQAERELFMGMKIFPLEGMPDGSMLAFTSEKDAQKFIRTVQLLMGYGAPSKKAIEQAKKCFGLIE